MTGSVPKAQHFSKFGSDSVGGVTIPYSTHTLSWVDSSSGGANPRFRSQIKNGENASTNFVGNKSEILENREPSVNFSGVRLSDRKPVILNGSGYTVAARPSFGVPTGISTSSADNLALGQFYTSARKAISSFNGGTFLGELRETIHMIKRPGAALSDLVHIGMDRYANLAKRYAGKRLTRLELNQALSGLYLEGVFGWLPLIADVNSAMDAYDKLTSRGPSSLQCRGFGKETKQTSQTTGTENIYTSNFPSDFTQVTSTEAQVLYYGKVKASIYGHGSLGNARELFGFKADEFVPTLWELMPWSFLIDYFANISEIVSATTFLNSQLAWTSKTTRRIAYVQRAGRFRHTLGSGYQLGGGGEYNWKTSSTQVNRIASVSPSVPGLELSLPGSSAKWANMAALLSQSQKLSSFFSKLVK